MLNEERKQFDKEQDQLLKTILNLRYFYPWQTPYYDETNLQNDSNLEIFITNICNQHCEYCYLTQFPDLYPVNNTDQKIILHNLCLLYDYIMENNFHIPKVEFFTGEIWHTQFGWDILQTTLDYLKKGLRVDWFLIASNCSFVFHDYSLQTIQHYINEFRSIGNDLVFSISIDGAVIENEERPLNDGTVRDDHYYEQLFSFAKYNHYFFHPMVAANSISKWIENHQWWYQQCLKYDMNIDDLMMLEVRNANWTKENLEDYNKFLDYLIDFYIQHSCNNDIEIFTHRLMDWRDCHGGHVSGYIPWCFPETDTFMGCTVATDMCIRLGDLAICPCHRTSYNKYIYGYFVIENDKIVDIKANNPQMAIKILMNNINIAHFGCDTCVFNNYCLKGCLGSQYENMGDPFIPIPNVCDFFKNKYGHLIEHYEQLGVISLLRKCTKYELEYPRIKRFLDFVDNYYFDKQKPYLGIKEDINNGMGISCNNVSRGYNPCG